MTPNKPRKNEVIDNLFTWATVNSTWLQFCSIPNKSLKAWVREPWQYKNFMAAWRFIQKDLIPALDEVITILSRDDRETWERLKLIDPGNPIFKILNEKRRNVHEVWKNRPRFPEDAHRKGSY